MTEAAEATSTPQAHAEGDRAIAVGVNLGIVSTGDHAQNVLISMPNAGLPEAGRTSAPPGTARLRAGRGAGVFVGREAELGSLTRAQAEGGAQVLVGLGGSGKSTLARIFAQQRREHDNPVWWIEGRTTELIESGLAEFATRLAPVFAGLPAPLASSWARSWLATHREWMLVLDDVDGPDEVRALMEELPDGGFLLTSRQGAGWQGLARAVPVRDLSAEHAAVLLELVIREGSQSGVEPDLTGAAELCDRLGRLPLAIEQAGAFIAQNVSTPAKYLELLASDGAHLLERGAVGADPRRTVARIWRVTFDRLAEDPHAAEILRVFAWYAPSDIPRALGASAGDSTALRASLNLLAAYHLVTLSSDAISVHPLVQEIARTPSDEDPHRSAEAVTRAREYATVLLMIACGKITGTGPETWPARRRMFPHIEFLAANTSPEQDSEYAATLFGWTGQSLHAQGDYPGAIRHLTRSADVFARLRGPSDERALGNRLSLGIAYRAAGDVHRGMQIQEEVLATATADLGATHTLTLTARASLPSAYVLAGDFDKAIAELRSLLELSVAERGEEDMNTRLARFNLAVVLTNAGQAEEAVEIYEVGYRSDLELLGPDDARTLLTANNFASALLQNGQLDRSLELLEHVVERRRELLGEDHPDTLVSLANLAVAEITSGDYDRAKVLSEHVLAARERVLGPEHPGTRDTREGLDALVQLMAKVREAEQSPSQEAVASEATLRQRLLRLFRR